MFASRQDGALALARALEFLRAQAPVVIGLPNGGVQVATVVGHLLGAPVDVLVSSPIVAGEDHSRPLGVVGDEHAEVLDDAAIAEFGLDAEAVAPFRRNALVDLSCLKRTFRGNRAAVPVRGRTVVLVDDRVSATQDLGQAVGLLRARGAGRVVVAAPAASWRGCERLLGIADEIVIAEEPEDEASLRRHYRDAREVRDADVAVALAAAAADHARHTGSAVRSASSGGAVSTARRSIPDSAMLATSGGSRDALTHQMLDDSWVDSDQILPAEAWHADFLSDGDSAMGAAGAGGATALADPVADTAARPAGAPVAASSSSWLDAQSPGDPPGGGSPPPRQTASHKVTWHDVSVPCDGVMMPGRLQMPAAPAGIVVFAQDGAGTRDGAITRTVASHLGKTGMGTLELEGFAADGRMSHATVSDVALMARNVLAGVHFLAARPLAGIGTHDSSREATPTALFGSGTGGGAVVVAAAAEPGLVRGVISESGRLDLAGCALAGLRSPARLIVGALDPKTLAINEQALAEMVCDVSLEVVPGASRGFPEPGALAYLTDAAARTFAGWFR